MLRPVLLTVAGVAAVLTSGPALAGSMDDVSWDGGYIGGNLDFRRTDPFGPHVISLHSGFDRQVGNNILGVEAEVSNADADAPGSTITWMTRGKLRAGVIVSQTLFYAVVGATRAETTVGAEYGVLAGAGVDHRIAPHWSVGGEALYHHFPAFNGGSHVGVQSISARLSYRF